MTSSNKNTTLAKNTVFLSIRMVFVMFVSLYTSRVFLHALGVEDFGINNVVCGFVAMFSFLNTSLANGIQRFYNSEMSISGNNGVQLVYTSALLIQGCIAVLVVLLLETIGIWYIYNEMVIPADRLNAAMWIYQFSIASSVLVIMQTPYSAAVMAYEKMNYYAVVGIVDVVLKLALALVIPYVEGDHLWFYGVMMLCISIVSFMMYVVYAKAEFTALKLKLEIHRGLLKKMITFSGWNFFGTFACMIREQGLNMVLNLFFGPVVNAARGIAYQVSSALQGFVSNVSVAAKPQMVSSFAEGNAERTIHLMYSMSKLSFFILYIMAVPVCLEINYILHLWLGNVVPEHTASFIVLVIFTNFMNNLNAPLSNVVYATGEMRNYEVTFSIINILIIPVAYIALRMGCPPEAAFISYFVMTVFVQVGCLYVIKTITEISLRSYFFKLCCPLMTFSIVALPLPYAVYSLMPSGFFRLACVTVVTCLVASVAFYWLGLNKKEKNMVVGIINRIETIVLKIYK
ncbi:lipopolysaccharide biosynthesis protein [Segatella baroniae]|uniref:lipopolysaccharide biosynthesis protein n=1 Tax=Segatella baroniae TaxID=305719 RepID=UPI00040CF6A1|nr:hypothetical protein [Segatella baroniae]